MEVRNEEQPQEREERTPLQKTGRRKRNHHKERGRITRFLVRWWLLILLSPSFFVVVADLVCSFLFCGGGCTSPRSLCGGGGFLNPSLSFSLSICKWWPLLPSLSTVVVAFYSLQFKTTTSAEPILKKWRRGTDIIRNVTATLRERINHKKEMERKGEPPERTTKD